MSLFIEQLTASIYRQLGAQIMKSYYLECYLRKAGQLPFPLRKKKKRKRKEKNDKIAMLICLVILEGRKVKQESRTVSKKIEKHFERVMN